MRSLLGVLAGVLLMLAPAAADDRQPIPPVARITDSTGTLTAEQKQSLDTKLTALEQSKGSQIAILIVPTTQPEEIEEFSFRVADAWKLGRKGVDDGALLVVAKNDHKVRIEVGRGLEGAIPDAATARIIREYITPKFRSGDFAGGINDAVDALSKLIDGEPLPPPLEGKRSPSDRHDAVNSLILALILGFWARSLFGWLPRLLRGGLVALLCGSFVFFISGIVYWAVGMGVYGLIVGLLGGVGGGRFASGGGWGGFGSGGFGGGGGGGGFSGGGGGFSGGGASGSW